MKTNHILILAAMLFLATANAATIAVLEITIANDEVDLSVDETKFLTDELRRQATQLLQKEYSILTREKIIALVPKTAENLNSVIDIGLVIKSDYVTQGFIGKLGNLFTLTVELYETSSGDMLGYFVKESTDLKGLLDAIRDNAPSLFAKIKQQGTQLKTFNEEPPTATTSIPTNIPSEPKKSINPTWIAIGLDVLGAAAFGLGIYNNSKASGYYSEFKKLREDLPATEGQYQAKKNAYEAKYKEVQSAETARNIFYVTGGALLLGGIAVHIWF